MGFFERFFANEPDDDAVPFSLNNAFLKETENFLRVNISTESINQMTDLTDSEMVVLKGANQTLADFFAALLQFEHHIINHPTNLEEFWEVWESEDFNDFMGYSAERIALIFGAAIGFYLVENQLMTWKKLNTSEGSYIILLHQGVPTLVFYPFAYILNGIKEEELLPFEELERKIQVMVRKDVNN